MSLQPLIFLVAFATLALGQDLMVNTPTSAQACLPVAISWTGGTPPVFVSLIPGGKAGSPSVKEFGSLNNNSLTWNVDQPAGSLLTVQIRDSKGILNYSDKFTVQPSGESCKTASPTAPGGSPPTDSSSATSGNATKSGTSSSTTSPTTPSTSNTSNTSPTTGGAPAAPAGSSDASRKIPGFFVLAFAGLLAILA